MAAQRIKLTLQYRGTQYSGWQIQPHGLSIQELLQKSVQKIFHHTSSVIGSGRTDAGVHALGQVCHLDIPSDHPLLRAHPENKLVLALNSQLPSDIVVKQAEKVADSFHAQRNAKRKTYLYCIHQAATPNALLNDFVWRIAQDLDWERIQQAAQRVVGQHDFRAFMAASGTAQTTEREIFSITFRRGHPFLNGSAGTRGEAFWLLRLNGSGFLKQMVRNIVGTLVEIGLGRRSVMEIKKILKSRDRRQAGQTAPARGLFLERVYY